MIDDGPAFKFLLHRSVKRFDLDLAAWPWPPDRGGNDWGSYWQVRFEDTIFRVGLGVRKLIEAAKLSIEVQARPIDVMFAPLRDNLVPNSQNSHRVNEYYETEAMRPEKIPVLALCHAVVHSHILVPRFSVSGSTGLRLQDFFLASDRGRKRGVYLVSWETIVRELVTPVVMDNVISIRIWSTLDGEELRIPASTDRPAEEHIEFYKDISTGNANAVEKFLIKWRQSHGLSPEVTL
ncbi:hypothetical protein [Streptomyces sp. NP-1717]|uniref:hypothetical protein n=1 Tax=Streptomyces sp. NP-1717 TaxID=2704470 RepID=UPI001F5DD2EF|nr:hypothetical protein [Streptomyces sp. NP-1717]MCI3225596.1 hypothetical protein [Streptomyces sp. NP-1717]